MWTLGKGSINYCARPTNPEKRAISTKKGNSQQRSPTREKQNLLQELTVIGAVQNRHIPKKPALLKTQNAAGVERMDIMAINASQASQNPSTKYRIKTLSTWHVWEKSSLLPALSGRPISMSTNTHFLQARQQSRDNNHQ